MRILAIIVLALSLSACAGGKTIVTEKEHIVVEPPAGLWDCPDAPAPPPTGASQAEVADYVLQLYQNQEVCKASIEAVKAYLEQAKKITKEVEK